MSNRKYLENEGGHMKRIYDWFCREAPDGLKAAKGIVNGVILGLAAWGFIWLCWFVYVSLGGQ